jgi:tetratricopeptide (TPR) repeat protein
MTLVPLLFFVLLELGLRVVGYGYPTEFFISSEIAGQRVYIDNPNYGRRFFPPGLARRPLPFAIAAEKPADTCRIFVLGESAALGFPHPAFSFARILEVMLRDRYPGTHFEIINTAMTGINSHVILPIARDCAGQHPDIFIVYLGNNEVVGPFGAANVLGPYSARLGWIRAHLAVKTTRVGQLLNDCAQLLSGGEGSPRSWGGMEMYLDSQIAADDPRLEGIYDNFRANLEGICDAGRSAGATTLICTVASNLKDCPPFASLHRADLWHQEEEKWREAYEYAKRAEAAGKPTDAVALYRKAAAIDDRHAELQFRLARCLEALGQLPEARECYRLARDRDTLRFRTDTRINGVTRQVAAARRDQEVVLVDAERSFADASSNGIPGGGVFPFGGLFHEHVHMTFAGNYVLARAVFERLADVLPPAVRARAGRPGPPTSEDECAACLAYAGWNQLEDAEMAHGMQMKPPFTSQLDHAVRERRRLEAIEKLRWFAEPAALKRQCGMYEYALAIAKDDWMVHANYARLNIKIDDLDGAAEHERHVLKALPHSSTAHQMLADILHRQGKHQEALEHCREALRLSPDFDREEIYHIMGKVLASQGKLDEALTQFFAALRLNPKNFWVHLNLGQVRDAQDDGDRAICHYSEAVRLAPDHPEPHFYLVKAFTTQGKIEEGIAFYSTLAATSAPSAEIESNLATLFTRAGKLDDAAAHYTAALKCNPNLAQVHLNFGTVLALQGKTDLAIREYCEALRLRPGWKEATERLAALQGKKQGPP